MVSSVTVPLMLPSGAMLIREGTEVNDRQIQLMKQRGITTVFVGDGETEDVSREVTPMVYAERAKKLEEMFAPVAQAPYMTAMREAVLERLKLRRPWE